MNAYLEIPIWELRQAWDNYKEMKNEAQKDFDIMQKNYENEFGHLPNYEKGLGGHNLMHELMKAKKNKTEKYTCSHDAFLRISLFFDPTEYVKQQRTTIATILAATSDENARVLVDVDLCHFILRWRNGGGFTSRGE